MTVLLLLLSSVVLLLSTEIIGQFRTELPASRQIMQVIVSLAILGISFFVILSNAYGPEIKYWAYGSVGTIIGFWVKGQWP